MASRVVLVGWGGVSGLHLCIAEGHQYSLQWMLVCVCEVHQMALHSRR